MNTFLVRQRIDSARRRIEGVHTSASIETLELRDALIDVLNALEYIIREEEFAINALEKKATDDSRHPR
jgi:hypothetical protein